MNQPNRPTQCRYAPPGEYVKDHTLIYQDGYWHLFSISGTEGFWWNVTGNEECFSWSISKDLVNWEFRGHVLHPSQRAGHFDQHEVWAPFCLRHDGLFYMFYTGAIIPDRPLDYARHRTLETNIISVTNTQGLAISKDLTSWEKIADPAKGLEIPGRDSHVVRDEENDRWLLYSTGALVDGLFGAYVSESKDLVNWKLIGPCVKFPQPDLKRSYGLTNDVCVPKGLDPAESLTIMRHPLNKQWIIMGNFHYALSDDPTDFLNCKMEYYDNTYNGATVDLGFACETILWNGKWYRSGIMGPIDYWKLGFNEIEWVQDGAFRIVTPSAFWAPNGWY